MNLKAILFDFEGTLVDFQWDLAGAVSATLDLLRESGFPLERLKSRKYSTLMQEAMALAAEIGYPPEKVREWIGDIYDRFDEDALTRWNLQPGVKTFFHLLPTEGIQAGLVSNVGKKNLEKALQQFGLLGCFNVVISRNDVQCLKPSGEGLTRALQRLHVLKDNTLHVGDSLDDILAAKEAGVKVIAIQGGENRKNELLSAGPDRCIRHFSDLSACLATLLSRS